jgi:CDP-glucose 4,6-dehydratase
MNDIKNERFGGVYRNSRVLVTGHTGFKGSWLSSWLIKLGAKVIGISDCIPTNPSLFEILKLENRIEHHICDVRDADMVARLISEAKPDFVFHLAAQAIVSTSYHDPLNTISTNVLGTANVLEALRHLDHPCTAVFITSDKCYENVEWAWGYKETDHLGGRDIYSGSKGAAEVIFHSYFWSFFRNTHKTSVRIASGRAGNVIGGGDWAKDRIVVDCIRNWAKGDVVEIRSPDSTRPWQHVLEPLSGYLTLGAELSRNLKLNGESFNFGPRTEQNKTVVSLISELRQHWELDPTGVAFRITSDVQFHEASLLRLNCDKAALFLKWEAAMNSANCIEMVGQWYSNYYTGNVRDAYELTLAQIGKYEDMAQQRGLSWTR